MFWRRSDSSASSNGSARLAVGEEIAELALVVGADRLVQRDGRGRGRQRLVDVLDRQAGRLGELVLRRLAAELDLEPPRRARQLLLALDDVHRHADRARVVRDRALHRLADPPGRVGRELVAAAPVELLDGAVQAERALLDQVEERHAEAAVALGDRDDEAQVRLDHAPLRAIRSPRSIAFARVTSSAAVSSLWRPTSARKSCSESPAPDGWSAS